MFDLEKQPKSSSKEERIQKQRERFSDLPKEEQEKLIKIAHMEAKEINEKINKNGEWDILNIKESILSISEDQKEALQKVKDRKNEIITKESEIITENFKLYLKKINKAIEKLNNRDNIKIPVTEILELSELEDSEGTLEKVDLNMMEKLRILLDKKAYTLFKRGFMDQGLPMSIKRDASVTHHKHDVENIEYGIILGNSGDNKIMCLNSDGELYIDSDKQFLREAESQLVLERKIIDGKEKEENIK